MKNAEKSRKTSAETPKMIIFAEINPRNSEGIKSAKIAIFSQIQPTKQKMGMIENVNTKVTCDVTTGQIGIQEDVPVGPTPPLVNHMVDILDAIVTNVHDNVMYDLEENHIAIPVGPNASTELATALTATSLKPSDKVDILIYGMSVNVYTMIMMLSHTSQWQDAASLQMLMSSIVINQWHEEIRKMEDERMVVRLVDKGEDCLEKRQSIAEMAIEHADIWIRCAVRFWLEFFWTRKDQVNLNTPESDINLKLAGYRQTLVNEIVPFYNKRERKGNSQKTIKRRIRSRFRLDAKEYTTYCQQKLLYSKLHPQVATPMEIA